MSSGKYPEFEPRISRNYDNRKREDILPWLSLCVPYPLRPLRFPEPLAKSRSASISTLSETGIGSASLVFFDASANMRRLKSRAVNELTFGIRY